MLNWMDYGRPQTCGQSGSALVINTSGILLDSTMKCHMHIPSSVYLSLLQISLAQCSYSFPLSVKVCCRKSLTSRSTLCKSPNLLQLQKGGQFTALLPTLPPNNHEDKMR